jgi:hypothetical protein
VRQKLKVSDAGLPEAFILKASGSPVFTILQGRELGNKYHIAGAVLLLYPYQPQHKCPTEGCNTTMFVKPLW